MATAQKKFLVSKTIHPTQDEEMVQKDGSQLYGLFQWQVTLDWYFPSRRQLVGRTPVSHVWLIFQEGLEHNVHAEITQCIFIKMHACKCPFGFLNHEAYCRDAMRSNMLPETVVVESRSFFHFLWEMNCLYWLNRGSLSRQQTSLFELYLMWSQLSI